MSLPISFNNVVYPAGFLGTDDGAPKASFKVDNASTYLVSVNGTINKIGDSVSLKFGADAPTGFAGQTITLTSTQYDNTGQILFSSTTAPPNATDAGTAWRYLLSNSQLHGKYLADGTTADPNRTTFTADSNDTSLNDYSVAAAPCYATGTLIRTTRGDVAVEDLVIGDLVVTASGVHRPIRWLGRRSYSGRFASRNPDLLPVCFKASSLADGVPARDLWVSPKHAMFLDGILVPADCLVNGVSVIKATRVDRIDYHHIELDSHDVLLAEGAPSESFVDDGSRNMFQNAHEHAVLYPAVVSSEAIFCAPRIDEGFPLEQIRQRLQARASTDFISDRDACVA